jgi:hypothetical protein
MRRANARLAPRCATATAFLLPAPQIISSTPLTAPALRVHRLEPTAWPTVSAAPISAIYSDYSSAPAVRAARIATPASPTMNAVAATAAIMLPADAVDRLATAATAMLPAVATTAPAAARRALAVHRVHTLATPAPPAHSAATEEFARAEDVAWSLTTPATPTLIAVAATAAPSPGAFASCDCFPHGFPCTRRGHSALAAPAPAAPSPKRHRG